MVQRYRHTSNGMEMCFDGPYIFHSEIAALEARCRGLEAEKNEIQIEFDAYKYYISNTPFGHWMDRAEHAEAENERLRKRLEPIEEWWERNCSDYIRNKHKKWDASMYEVIEQCMGLK